MLNFWKKLQKVFLNGPFEVIWEERRFLSGNLESRVEFHKLRNLYNLEPFLDRDGLLHVRGRLGKSRLSHSETHPLVLLKQSNISVGIIRWLPMVEVE